LHPHSSVPEGLGSFLRIIHAFGQRQALKCLGSVFVGWKSHSELHETVCYVKACIVIENSKDKISGLFID